MYILSLVYQIYNIHYKNFKTYENQRMRAHKTTNHPTDFFKNFPSRNDIQWEISTRVATSSAFLLFFRCSAFPHKNLVDGKNSYTIKIFTIEEFLSGLSPLPLFAESFRFFTAFPRAFRCSAFLDRRLSFDYLQLERENSPLFFNKSWSLRYIVSSQLPVSLLT